jgi:hypothetical protein
LVLQVKRYSPREIVNTTFTIQIMVNVMVYHCGHP